MGRTQTVSGKLGRTAPMRRKDFLRARSGAVFHSPIFVMQAVRRNGQDQDTNRFGITVTLRNGNAVVRNRIRRRLRNALTQCARSNMVGSTDYVLIARRAALTSDFAELTAELERGLDRLRVKLAHNGVNDNTVQSMPATLTDQKKI